MSASTSSTQIIAQPQPAASINPTDSFFGYTFSSSVSDSRHDTRISSPDIDLELGLRCVSSPDVAPPPYVEPPEYTKSSETVTLAKYLFKFGFLFPPFWIMGALIILTPLRAPDADIDDPTSPHAWLPEKTEAERATILSHLRKAELKWAWRCLFALLILVVLVAIAGVAIWAVLRA
ncbi:hypothetical protein E1B28_007839 [Marasmius oreades]|uniref:Uncharacterized protein n=1 Tax=Marasmius oreades TaxID=181124 RepID=A0A9P7UU67_9AGAR|nr:uncharacterized protein E1B28_007839 [Marasmius oreades]KAG7094233.1 hypothetical protein E1B28_007839 [Marasmius oreades]